ncbi:MAG TPA: metalloregulator ArsR/SmtB family transcription factor [Candidatus Obscuribacterales bacterium]
MLVTKELSELLGVLAHPCRLRIVEELRAGEKDVNALSETIGIAHSGMSQHLSILRAHKLVAERRQGRNVFYHLRYPGLASWLLEGLEFITPDADNFQQLRSAVRKAKKAWS